jgi:phenylalanyl-tRNA synthetase beta chain
VKLSVKWLKEYVDTRLSAEKIAEKLTMVGLEVDEIIGGHNFSGVVVGHVLSVEKHPNADKLNVASVDVGDEKLQIVCGATNLKAGQVVPVAIVGAKLGDYEISKASLRGVDSYGMICSEKELGLGEDHDGIMILGKSENIGEVYVSDKGSDTVLDVKVLANRPDCMSVVGLAREVAVATGSKLSVPPVKVSTTASSTDFNINVEAINLCPRYMARFVTGLTGSESPQWMKDKLAASGTRPISLFVDISNYVMLEYGQPLHFFDMDKLTDKTITVRSAKEGEKLVTLDGVKRTLTKENLVIADSKAPIALAGVMGGSDTEIDAKTRNILIEAAVFDKASVRRTSRALGLRSEAVARFEKGIPIGLPEIAIDRAAQLLRELGQGSISKTLVDTIKTKVTTSVIPFDIARLNTFLGTNISEKDALGVLSSLGCETTKAKSGYLITPPYWRVDLVENVDLYEEVIRIVGYDKVPTTLPQNAEVVTVINKYYKSVSKIRNRLSAVGFDEIMTYSFIGADELVSVGLDATRAPKILNPLVSDQQHLRLTMVPQMLKAIRDNQFHSDTLRFFEIGKSFESMDNGKLPEEVNWLVLGMTSDYYDAKGIVYNLLGGFSVIEDEIVVKQTTTTFLKKGMAADLFVQGKRIASLGEIREEVRTKFDLKSVATVVTLNIDVLMAIAIPETKFEPFSKYQEVTRDVSANFDNDIVLFEIKKKLSRVSKLLKKIEILDIYVDKKVQKAGRSITLRFHIQSDDHTLIDSEVEEVISAILSKITEIGGKLRYGN